jgi:hypothetical protein
MRLRRRRAGTRYTDAVCDPHHSSWCGIAGMTVRYCSNPHNGDAMLHDSFTYESTLVSGQDPLGRNPGDDANGDLGSKPGGAGDGVMSIGEPANHADTFHVPFGDVLI